MSPVTAAAPEGALIRTAMHGGVLLAVMDMPGRTMNVFSWAMMDALEALIARIESDGAITAAVLTSGKAAFLAGADLEMVRDFTSDTRALGKARMHERAGRLGRLFSRLEGVAKPVVAAINGLALGGGMEVALACRVRVVADDPRIQLGVPEIKLGLIPGAGGTQRLPRLVGIEKGMALLLSGDPVAPAEARSIGLVDEIVARERLIERAIGIAGELSGRASAPRLATNLAPGPFDFAAPDAVRRITRHYGYSDEVVTRYPAYDAIVRSTLGGAGMAVSDGSEVEMARFVDLITDTRVAANMVSTLFLGRQKAEKTLAQVTAPTGVRFAVTAEGGAADALRSALVSGKATIIEPSDAGAGDVVIAACGAQGRADLQIVTSGGDRLAGGTGIHLGRSRAYGSAIEILGDAAGREHALKLARLLRATPYRHGGQRSLLATLADVAATARELGLDEDARTAALALAARRLAAVQEIGDSEAADVACVVSGVFPAYAGGPFTWLAQHDDAAITALAARQTDAARALFAPAN